MKNLYSSVVVFAVLSLAAANPVEAEVVPHRLIADGMVLQREMPVRLWGTADPGENVDIKISNVSKSNKKLKKVKRHASTNADEQGLWTLEIEALPVGTGYQINIGDKQISDVMVGDVLLCSGQSNMELPVRRVTDMFAAEIAAYENPEIHYFRVPNTVEFHQPNDNLASGEWVPLTQDNVMEFSALGYFMAKEMYARTGVPVGIINASWGGTPIEAWMSEEALADFPRQLAEKRIYADDGYRMRIKQLEGENYRRWDATVYATDPGIQAEVKWFMPEADDSQWEVVDQYDADWANDGYMPINGTHWFRKSVDIDAADAQQDGILRLGCLVDADSVYVNGHFVGNITYQYPPRIYKVPAEVLHPGENNITIRLFSQNGLPHFVAEKPYKLILGDKEYNLEGEWRHHVGAVMPHGPGMEFYQYKPTVLYNALIHPIRNYNVMGAVWYQGESNVDRAYEYERLLPLLISNWRETFDQDMPFYVVELADFLAPSDRRGRAQWANMRSAQAAGVKASDNAYLIHNSDLGEWNDIHPLDKKTLAGRVVDKILENKHASK